MGTKKAKTTSRNQPKAPPPAIAAAITIQLAKLGSAKSVPEPKLVQLPMEKVLPTAENPRHHRLTVKDASVIELAESIKGMGLLEPVIVRVHPTRKGFWELRAGERRFLAHQLNKAKRIPAIVHALNDAQAAMVTTLENLQREDLRPLEEAQSVAMLLKNGKSLREVAAAIGKSHQWVARRASLVKLVPEWVAKFEKHHTPPGAMELIARYQEHEQKRLLKTIYEYHLECADPGKRIQDELNRAMRPLSGAIWKLEEEIGSVQREKRPTDTKSTLVLQRFPKCSECKNRTSERGAAFDGPDRCLDAECYEGKRDTVLARKETELKKQHPKLIRLAGGPMSDAEGAAPAWKFEDSKPGAKDAIPALVVSGPGTGSLKWVKSRYTDYSQPEKPTGPKTLKAKQGELESKRWAETVKRFRQELVKAPLTALKDPMTAVLLTATFGTGWDVEGEWENFEALQNHKPEEQLRAAAECMWEYTREVISELLAYNGPVTQYNLKHVEEARTVAKLIKFDLQALYNTVCKEKGFTEPKCWTAAKNSPTGSK